MKPTREQCLQWAKEASEETTTEENMLKMGFNLIDEFTVVFARKVHADGQRVMQERAAERMASSDTTLAKLLAAEIRNLEIEE